MTSSLTPSEAARESARAIHDLAAAFMLDMDTYRDAAAAGYEGMSFYFGGRGGVLGDVDADAVYEALVFFPRETVRAGWEAAAGVATRAQSARLFAEACHRWAAEHLSEDSVDLRRLAALTGRIVAEADGSGAPVFSGWRELPEPAGERELVLHRFNALRELRAARHADSLAEVDLEPRDAFMVKTPYMAAIFGWPEPEAEPDEATRDKWERAEALTNDRFGADLAVLSGEELAEFCNLAEATRLAAG